jgi:hypothetical protein
MSDEDAMDLIVQEIDFYVRGEDPPRSLTDKLLSISESQNRRVWKRILNCVRREAAR